MRVHVTAEKECLTALLGIVVHVVNGRRLNSIFPLSQFFRRETASCGSVQIENEVKSGEQHTRRGVPALIAPTSDVAVHVVISCVNLRSSVPT